MLSEKDHCFSGEGGQQPFLISKVQQRGAGKQIFLWVFGPFSAQLQWLDCKREASQKEGYPQLCLRLSALYQDNSRPGFLLFSEQYQ